MNNLNFYYAKTIDGKSFLCCNSHNSTFETKNIEAAQDLAKTYNKAIKRRDFGIRIAHSSNTEKICSLISKKVLTC